MKRRGLTIALLLAVLVPWLAFARGESSKTPAELEKQFLILIRRVNELENRVAQLEKTAARANTPAKAPVAAGKEVWRQLKKGMTEGDIRQLLGEPKTINAGYLTYWYYSESRLGSHVIFVSGRVYGWDEPE